MDVLVGTGVYDLRTPVEHQIGGMSTVESRHCLVSRQSRLMPGTYGTDLTHLYLLQLLNRQTPARVVDFRSKLCRCNGSIVGRGTSRRPVRNSKQRDRRVKDDS